MKILMISDVYFPRINGVSTSIKTFRQNLQQMGHEVHLICPAYRNKTANEEPGVYRIPSYTVPFDTEDRLMKTRYIYKLLETLRREQFDIIHIQTPFLAHRVGVRIANELSLPVVETYHTFFEEYFYHYIPFLPKQWLKYYARRLTKNQSLLLNAMVVPSSAMFSLLRDYGVCTPMTIVPTGLDVKHFNQGDGIRFRRRHNIAQHRPVLVHIGRIAYEKNIEFLLHVLHEIKHDIPDILLIIAGEGPAKQSLQQLAKSLDLTSEILFIGYLSRETELLDCYKAGEVFVFSSRTETQGLVLLEAMASGVPVVSIAEMGTKDILSPGKGCIVAKETVADFSRKVKSLLQSPVLRDELSRSAKLYASTWSTGAMTQRLIDFYKEQIELTSVKPDSVPRYAVD